jgi:hypothetical protein
VPGTAGCRVGLFSLAGFAEIVDCIGGVEKIRLLLGAEPPSRPLRDASLS